MTTANFDPAELAKFSALAHRWWDPTSEFRPLHEINPLRLAHIERLAGGLSGKRIVDVGCGGGILAEAMAAKGATVTGIDLDAKTVAVEKMEPIAAKPWGCASCMSAPWNGGGGCVIQASYRCPLVDGRAPRRRMKFSSIFRSMAAPWCRTTGRG